MERSRNCREGGLCEAVVLLKQTSLELQVTSCQIRLSPACHRCYYLATPRVTEAEPAGNYPSPLQKGSGAGGRRVFCWFNSLKWLIRRPEESQGMDNGGSGAVGPERRNEGSKALLQH